MLILVLKNLQLEKLSKIKQWFITPHRCSVFVSATPSCPRLSRASVLRSCDPGSETLFCTPRISPCPRLAQHAWMPTAHKGAIQTPRPFLKEAAATWPPWTNLIVGPCMEPPARCPSAPRGIAQASSACENWEFWNTKDSKENIWIRCCLSVLHNDFFREFLQ